MNKVERNHDLLELSKKTALITGASSGLGAEFANQLAAMGFDLILVARREDRLQQLGASIQANFGVETKILPADLSIQIDIERVIAVINQTSNIELLVNNAGFGLMEGFLKADIYKELAQMQVHMIAPVLLCRAVLPGMISRNKGAIINVSSIAGIIPVRSNLYGSSKAFLIIFTESLRDMLHNKNIQVQALCPGFTYTEFHDTSEYTNFSRESIPGFLWMTSKQVVKESLQDLHKNKVICIPGHFYRFAGILARNSFTAGLIKYIGNKILRRRKHLYK
jgi:hypothetical protein